MKATRNPFLDEGTRIYFSQPSILRTYLLLVGLAGLALLVWWPRESLAAALRRGGSPDSFAAAAIGMYVALMYLGARYGSEAYAPDTVRRLQEYVSLTPVTVRSIVRGKIGFAFLHTAFLLALGTPLLLAALGVSGLEPKAVLEALLVLGAATLAVRMYGLVLLVFLGARKGLRDAILLVGTIGFFGVSVGLYPPSNPVIALVSVSTRGLSSRGALPHLFSGLPYYWFSVLVDLLAALLMAGVTAWRLAAMRRRAREAGHG
jgi:hypothetical protein